MRIRGKRDGVVGIVATLRLGQLFNLGSFPEKGFSLQNIRTCSRLPWVRGVLSLGVKQPRPEADHSSPYSAAFNKSTGTWSYTITPPYAS